MTVSLDKRVTQIQFNCCERVETTPEPYQARTAIIRYIRKIIPKCCLCD